MKYGFLLILFLLFGLNKNALSLSVTSLSYSYYFEPSENIGQKREALFSRIENLLGPKNFSTYILEGKTGIDRVSVSSDLSQMVFVKTGFKPSDPSLNNKIQQIDEGFLYHGKTKDGLSYGVFFKGYILEELGPFLNDVRFSILQQPKSQNSSVFISSAWAEDECSEEQPTYFSQFVNFTKNTFNPEQSKAAGCIVGVFKGVWDSTGGAVAGVANMVAHPIQSAKAVWSGAQNFWKGVQAFQRDVTGTMERLYGALSRMPPGKLQEIKCRISAALGTGLLVTYFTAGVGGPAVLLKISQLLASLERTAAFGPILLPLKISRTVKSAAIARELSLATKTIKVVQAPAQKTSLIVSNADRDGIDLQTENPGLQIEAPESIGDGVSTQVRDPVADGIDLQTENPGLQIEAPESIGDGLPVPARDPVIDGIELQNENPGLQIEAPESVGVLAPTSLGAQLRVSGFQRDLLEPSPGNTQFSLTIAGTFPAEAGGRSYLIRRNGNRDFSEIHDLDDGIYRGDPMWAIDGAGEEAASFFGFKKLKKTLVTAPDAIQANLILNRFNEGLPAGQRINVQYYQPAVERVPQRSYVDRFVTSGELPLANQGTEAIHDVVFHYFPLLYMPPRILELHRKQMKMLLEFHDFIRDRHPALMKEIGMLDSPGSIDTAVKLENIESRVSVYVDALTSEPLVAFERFRADRYADSMRTMTMEDSAIQIKNFLYGGAAPIDLIKKMTKTESPGAKAAVDEFLATIPTTATDLRTGLTITPEQIVTEINQRVQFVNERARSLSP